MSEKWKFDFSNVDEIEVEEESKSKAIGRCQQRLFDLEDVQILRVRTYKVRAKFNGCIYNVEAQDSLEAEDILREYIKQKRRRALGNLQANLEAEDILRDLNTAVEVEGEIDAEPEIRQTEDGPERVE